MDIWWSLHLRREPASVPLARRILLGTMATAGVDPEVSYEVGVALSEACANAVEHARPDADPADQADPADPADDGFHVTATIEGDLLRIVVADSGPGFGARAHLGARNARRSAESGRGMYLIRALSDHVQVRNHPRRGAEVCFDRTLTYRSTAATGKRPLAHAS